MGDNTWFWSNCGYRKVHAATSCRKNPPWDRLWPISPICLFLAYFVVLSTKETQQCFVRAEKRLGIGYRRSFPTDWRLWVGAIRGSVYDNFQWQLFRNCIRTLTLLKILSWLFHHWHPRRVYIVCHIMLLRFGIIWNIEKSEFEYEEFEYGE
jgi:hypothetical protein